MYSKIKFPHTVAMVTAPFATSTGTLNMVTTGKDVYNKNWVY